jgi:ABC-type spermidine/putrescine transport system permease subunit I
MEGSPDLQWLEFLFLALLPYVVCLVLFITKKQSIMSFSGAVAPVLLDMFTYYSVFVSPTSSTASLALLWMPIWNLIIFMPIGLLIGYFIDRRRKKMKGNPNHRFHPDAASPRR